MTDTMPPSSGLSERPQDELHRMTMSGVGVHR